MIFGFLTKTAITKNILLTEKKYLMFDYRTQLDNNSSEK